MKHLFVLFSLCTLFITPLRAQQEPECRRLLGELIQKLDERIRTVAAARKIGDSHIDQLNKWFGELKAVADNNNLGLFTKKEGPVSNCNRDFESITRNFFNSGKLYIFDQNKYATLEACTGGYADELNSNETFGRLKGLSFILRAIHPLSNSNTLSATEKKSYTAFDDYLFLEKNPNDPGIYAFFYTHIDDIRKATGFEPQRGTQDSKIFAQNFILSFRPHLQYYFGYAEEEFARVDAAEIRSNGTAPGFYREYLHAEFVKGLRLIRAELNKLKENCGAENSGPLKRFTTRVTYSSPEIRTATIPAKPTGEAGRLKPGHGWVLLGVLNANGSIFKEYGDNPLIQLFKEENGRKRYIRTITSSRFEQVEAGTYLAVVSIAAYPQSRITVNAGGETRVGLRLGRLVLDPRNFDGTAGNQEIRVLAVVEEPKENSTARLSSTTVSNVLKGRSSLDLAPGRYVVETSYGIRQKDTVTVYAQQVTTIALTGAAKFTAGKESIDLRRIMPDGRSEWIAVLKDEQDIQLPPGEYEIRPRASSQPGRRITLESGQAYTYSGQ